MKIFNAKEKREFYSTDKICKLNADYNLVYGEKSNGKSFAVKEEFFKHWLETGGEFVLVRRYDTEISKFQLERYIADTSLHVSEWSGGKYNELYVFNKQIYACFRNENGERKGSKRWGYALALNLAQSYSGNGFPLVDRIVLEEFISLDGKYLNEELFYFNHVISTVARDRNIKTYMLANSISRLSPYWREYGIADFIPRQEQGTIALITRETTNGEQRVAVEYCDNAEHFTRMFSGKRQEMITKGKWLTKEMPHLPFSIKDCEVLYTFVVQYHTRCFKVEYVVYKGLYALYVTPKTTPIKKNTRVISNYYSADPLYTLGFKGLNDKERRLFELFRNGKVFYCDNMTGTEFIESMKNLNKITPFV